MKVGWQCKLAIILVGGGKYNIVPVDYTCKQLANEMKITNCEFSREKRRESRKKRGEEERRSHYPAPKILNFSRLRLMRAQIKPMAT